jgi:hypothetical protein
MACRHPWQRRQVSLIGITVGQMWLIKSIESHFLPKRDSLPFPIDLIIYCSSKDHLRPWKSMSFKPPTMEDLVDLGSNNDDEYNPSRANDS